MFGGEKVGMKSARVKAGKTVAQVMKEMGVSDAAVYMWETGKTKPRASLLPRLASFYGCTIDELLAADD